MLDDPAYLFLSNLNYLIISSLINNFHTKHYVQVSTEINGTVLSGKGQF